MHPVGLNHIGLFVYVKQKIYTVIDWGTLQTMRVQKEASFNVEA